MSPMRLESNARIANRHRDVQREVLSYSSKHRLLLYIKTALFSPEHVQGPAEYLRPRAAMFVEVSTLMG